jgi:threonine dehydrogenase-like Zn-dependent dehydrogenase
MHAVRIYGPGDIRLEETDIPQPGSDDMLLKIGACGICGSDAMFNAMGSIWGPDTPMPLGHEFSGTVESCGKNVTAVKTGDRVVVDPMLNDILIGCGSLEGGAFADYLLVKDAGQDNLVFRIPEQLSMTEAAFTEPLAVALHAVNVSEPTPDSKVVVYGAGPIGLGAVISLKAKGIKDIAVIDLSDYRLQLASDLGASATHNPATGKTKDFLSSAFGSYEGLGGKAPDADIYIDAVGVGPVFDEIMHIARYGACITVVAMHKKPVEISLDMLVAKSLQLKGSIGYPTEFGEALQILARDDVDISKVITHQFPLKDFHNAFEQSLNANESGKVMVVME